MNSLRATLAMTGMLLALAACTEQTVVPTEPSRDAPLTSIPGSPSVTVRSGLEAARYLDATAAAWTREGNDQLSRDLKAQRERVVRTGARSDSRRKDLAPSRPSLALSTDETEVPSPTTTPDAEIYYSSTDPYVNGRTATIVSGVTYFGNIAISEVTYSANDASGGVVIPQNTVTNRGEGQLAPCIGNAWKCAWTFVFQTVITLDLGKDCGVTVHASANHTAQWTTPSALKLPAAIWGSTYASNAKKSASNGPCTPPQQCLDASASNYGGPLPCTYPSSPTGGDGSTSGTTSGSTTQPPTYDPAPFVPSGHWECYLTYVGTDYETEQCTWYSDYLRVPNGAPAFARNATDASAAATLVSADLPSVFVIVSDKVPADAMAVIERHRQGPFRNVLLVPSRTMRPAALVAALRALADSRRQDGEMPSKNLQLTLKGGILDQQIPAAAREYAAGFTSLIATARRADAGTYGVRPILEIRLGGRN